MKKNKIGRNEPCPCGSGKKFKRCHGGGNLSPELMRKIEEIRAIQKQQVKQQGLGKGIISCEVKGHRIVAVGNKVYWSKEWKTFHDFLSSYIKKAIGEKWGNAELKKPRYKCILSFSGTNKYVITKRRL